jgi:hypothetical protein
MVFVLLLHNKDMLLSLGSLERPLSFSALQMNPEYMEFFVWFLFVLSLLLGRSIRRVFSENSSEKIKPKKPPTASDQAFLQS